MLNPVEAKLIAVLVVTVGSVVCGAIPALLGLGRRYQQSTLLSSVLCFGGGVLFATSVVHILPDVRNDLPKWSELIFCLGFLLIYFIDSFISFFNGYYFQRNETTEESLLPDEHRTHYGTVDIGREPCVSFNENPSRRDTEIPNNCCTNTGLLIAFTVHSLLEGLVIGIQDTEYGVLLLLGAVCSHKLLVAFCLGAEIVANGSPWQSLIYPMSIFIFGSDLGIFIGMMFQADSLASIHTTVPLIEGLAGGTLLYISLCEIVPREKARNLPAFATLCQFLALFIGFSLMEWTYMNIEAYEGQFRHFLLENRSPATEKLSKERLTPESF